MEKLDVLEAETRFDELLERVEQGETIVITRFGKPFARFQPPLAEDAETPPCDPAHKGQ